MRIIGTFLWLSVDKASGNKKLRFSMALYEAPNLVCLICYNRVRLGGTKESYWASSPLPATHGQMSQLTASCELQSKCLEFLLFSVRSGQNNG